MGNDADQKKYDEELKGLLERQAEEMKKKMNPLFIKMHALSDEEAGEMRLELEKAHKMQQEDLAAKYGIKTQ